MPMPGDASRPLVVHRRANDRYTSFPDKRMRVRRTYRWRSTILLPWGRGGGLHQLLLPHPYLPSVSTICPEGVNDAYVLVRLQFLPKGDNKMSQPAVHDPKYNGWMNRC